MSSNLLAIFYLISGILFILALRGLSSPETSRKGNLFGIIGMVIAIGVTFLSVGNFSTGFLYVLVFLLILLLYYFYQLWRHHKDLGFSLDAKIFLLLYLNLYFFLKS